MSPHAEHRNYEGKLTRSAVESKRSVYFPLSSEFQEEQLTPATLPPRSNYNMRIILLDAPCLPQSVESPGHTEGVTASEQTTNLANSSPRVVEQFEYLLIERLRGANSP
jgi:hypothetical protein